MEREAFLQITIANRWRFPQAPVQNLIRHLRQFRIGATDYISDTEFAECGERDKEVRLDGVLAVEAGHGYRGGRGSGCGPSRRRCVSPGRCMGGPLGTVD